MSRRGWCCMSVSQLCSSSLNSGNEARMGSTRNWLEAGLLQATSHPSYLKRNTDGQEEASAKPDGRHRKKGSSRNGVFSLEKSLEFLKHLNALDLQRMVGFFFVFHSLGSRISKFSSISRKWTFLKRPLFQKTLFPNPRWRLCTWIFLVHTMRPNTITLLIIVFQSSGWSPCKGHNPPRGSLTKFASQSSQGPLRGSLRGFCGVSAGVCRALRGSAGFSKASDPILVTLGNCWVLGCLSQVSRHHLPKHSGMPEHT